MAKKILTVEDDNFLLGLETKKLEDMGYEVLTATNSDEAFLHMDKNGDEISIMILDLLLPGVDGYGILAKMRDERILEGVPVIVFSNLYEIEDIERAKKLGVEHFYVKANFTLDELIRTIKELIPNNETKRKII